MELLNPLADSTPLAETAAFTATAGATCAPTAKHYVIVKNHLIKGIGAAKWLLT